jgi:hypothetical protein
VRALVRNRGRPALRTFALEGVRPHRCRNAACIRALGVQPDEARALLMRMEMNSQATGKATKSASTFRMECSVRVNIRATPAKIWSLLTNASDFPRWNSTVTKLEGTIAQGSKLGLQVKAAPGRVFRPKVAVLTPEREMVWADGAAPMFRGVRTFTLTPKNDGTTDFAMAEVFSGAMLPLIKRSLPDFGPPFEQYASDLKSEAERGV